jgi:hypothetical protein
MFPGPSNIGCYDQMVDRVVEELRWLGCHCAKKGTDHLCIMMPHPNHSVQQRLDPKHASEGNQCARLRKIDQTRTRRATRRRAGIAERCISAVVSNISRSRSTGRKGSSAMCQSSWSKTKKKADNKGCAVTARRAVDGCDQAVLGRVFLGFSVHLDSKHGPQFDHTYRSSLNEKEIQTALLIRSCTKLAMLRVTLVSLESPTAVRLQ